MKTERRVIAAFIGILCVISVLTLTSNSVPGLAREKLSDKPICQQRDWLKNVRVLTQSPRLVHSSKADGDEDYYFKGDTSAFNEFLRKFAAVKLPKRRIAVKNQYGKISHKHFDWVLHIPGQTNSKGGKDREAKEAYPSVTVYAAASGIHLADVVLPEGADVVVLESGDEDHWQVGKGVEIARKWALARREWLQFIEPHVERLRQQDNDPTIQWVEMRSRLLSEYLSGHIVRLIETTRSGRSCIFAVSVSGEISDLGSGAWSQKKGQEYFRSVKLSDFFRVQDISVADADTAIGIIKLTEEISYAPGQATMLRRSTNNFTIFDSRLYERFSWNENWEYDAKRKAGYWLVTRSYVGPPASIIVPPRWEIVLGKKGQLVEIRYK
jgi:hypothetical protein